MAPTFEDFIQSQQFTFLVGQEGKSIVVHAAAIAATSQQLDALINGGMEESESRCAKIEDVQVDDFIRFCEYAYRGDYTVPPWEELQHQPRDDDGWGFSALPSKDKKKGKKKRLSEISRTPEPVLEDVPPITEIDQPQAMWFDETEPEPASNPQYEVKTLPRTRLRTQFNSRKYLNDGGPKALILQQFEPKPNSTVDQNFTPVFLAHARLYSFANSRLIAPLKALTLDKLHKTLIGFKLYTGRIGDIIELARYAYSDPDLPDRKDDGTLDDLRKLVVEYIVCEMDTIGKCGDFVKYMEEGGEFVGDFWTMVRDYMA